MRILYIDCIYARFTAYTLIDACVHSTNACVRSTFCLCYEQQNVAANARAHEHSLFGASPARKKRKCGASEENFEIFREVFIPRIMVLYRKFRTESATTRTLIVFTLDKVDSSSRP